MYIICHNISIGGEFMPGKGYKPKKANKKNKVRKNNA
jgi:hypothetical protein|tara:strand:+ start:185 stop:295 length:111 start_codon:yes stop_codon:yes gene_type:complete